MHGGNVWQGEGPAGWLDFSASLRPEGPPEWVLQALKAGMADAAYYPDPEGTRERRALGRFLSLPEDRVLPTAGGTAAIALVSGLEATGTIVFAPCFGEYARQAAGMSRAVPLLSAPHTVGDPAAQIEGQLTRGCAVWICNPENPLGVAFSRAQIARVLKKVEAVGGWLIVDEAFIEYCPERTCTGLLETSDRLIVAGSLTKILGIPGVRLGYLCARPEVLGALRRRQLPWDLNCFAAATLRAFPGRRSEIMADAEKNARRREALRSALEGLGAFVYPSDAPFLLADFGRPVSPIAACLRKRGILVRECADFEGVDDGRHLRLAVRTDAENARLVAALKEAMTCAENL